MYGVKAAQSATFIIAEPLLIAAALYFVLTFPTSKLIGYFERRMRRGDIR
jgi:polar amino acid transport system permease protein